MSYRTSILCIAVEVLFLLLVVIVCIVVDELIYEQVTGIEPFKQGFFCDDESIMKPYTTKSSIKFEFADILKAGIVVSLAMILVVELELYVVKRRNADGLSTDDDENKFGKLSVPSWIIRLSMPSVHTAFSFYFAVVV
ncbi:hypothetical protein QZH41_016858, partial [Actinostola sp. cb2023]